MNFHRGGGIKAPAERGVHRAGGIVVHALDGAVDCSTVGALYGARRAVYHARARRAVVLRGRAASQTFGNFLQNGIDRSLHGHALRRAFHGALQAAPDSSREVGVFKPRRDAFRHIAGKRFRDRLKKAADFLLRFQRKALVQPKPARNLLGTQSGYVNVRRERGVQSLLKFLRCGSFQLRKNPAQFRFVCVGDGVQLEALHLDLQIGDFAVIAFRESLQLRVVLRLVNDALIQLQFQRSDADFQGFVIGRGHFFDLRFQFTLKRNETVIVEGRPAVFDLQSFHIGGGFDVGHLVRDGGNLVLEILYLGLLVQRDDAVLHSQLNLGFVVFAQTVQAFVNLRVGRVQRGEINLAVRVHQQFDGGGRLPVRVLHVTFRVGVHGFHAAPPIAKLRCVQFQPQTDFPVQLIQSLNGILHTLIGVLRLRFRPLEYGKSFKIPGIDQLCHQRGNFRGLQLNVAETPRDVFRYCPVEHPGKLVGGYRRVGKGVFQFLTGQAGLHLLHGKTRLRCRRFARGYGFQLQLFRHFLLVVILDFVAAKPARNAANARADRRPDARANDGNHGADGRANHRSGCDAANLQRAGCAVRFGGFRVALLFVLSAPVEILRATDEGRASRDNAADTGKASRGRSSGGRGAGAESCPDCAQRPADAARDGT